MDNKMILPQVINLFNVYKDGVKQIGVANEVSLAEVVYKLVTIDGAGIPGSYEEAVIGNFDSIKQVIPFSNLHTGMIDFSNPMVVQDVIMRGSMQVTNIGTGATDYTGIRVAIKGKCTNFNPGQFKQGDKMSATVTIECMKYLVEVGGVVLMDIDKWNGKYIVNGVDLLEKARKYC
jgi:P2 family phage contractile tail tube protein